MTAEVVFTEHAHRGEDGSLFVVPESLANDAYMIPEEVIRRRIRLSGGVHLVRTRTVTTTAWEVVP